MVAGEWETSVQAVLIGILLAVLVVKLFSVFSFGDNKHYLVHRLKSSSIEVAEGVPESRGSSNNACDSAEDCELIEASLSEDDEHILEEYEDNEIDGPFSAASAFVAVSASGFTQKLSDELKLKLYGLYKAATEGPCTVPRPPPIKFAAHAKWQAWKKLGDMTALEAMQKYIDTVTEHYPSWASCSIQEKEELRKHENGSMGPVFSTFVNEEEPTEDSKMEDLHEFSREGDLTNLIQCLDDGISVDMKDSDGRTALHWAVDRGRLSIVELLIARHADVNVKDGEGQTPLHYASICDREEIAQFLVSQNADISAVDNDSESPFDIRGSSWKWMHPFLP